MASLKSTDTGYGYKYTIPVDSVDYDMMMYGVSFEIDGQRIDPRSVTVHRHKTEVKYVEIDHQAPFLV